MTEMTLSPVALPSVTTSATVRQTAAAGPAPDRVLLVLDATDLSSAAALGLDPVLLSGADDRPGRDRAEVPSPAAVRASVTLPAQGGLLTVLVAEHTTAEGADLRLLGAELGRRARGLKSLVVALPALTGARARALVEGVLLGGFVGPTWARTTGRHSVAELVLVGDEAVADGAAEGVVSARATALARALGIAPPNLKTPQWLAEQAAAAGGAAGLSVRVWSPAELQADGFGGHLAVGSGSVNPPRFVRLDYRPDPDLSGQAGRPRHVVLVGKGITFDSGGLNLKPGASMTGMKTDMAGAAAVLGALTACRELAVPVAVTGLLAIAENSPSGSAYRPGDVITQFGGTTVEVGNTDAEGRLVLADALAYADQEIDPDIVIDIATLTGSATNALGRSIGALFSNDDPLREALLAASAATGEPMWPFPLWNEYRPRLDSPVADLSHISKGPAEAGAITAALFLREFVGGRRWAHLDIAGPGRSEKDTGLVQEGATGFGARLLLRYLEGLA